MPERQDDKVIEFTVEGFKEGYAGEDGEKDVIKLCYDFNNIVDAEIQSGENLLKPLSNLSRMTAGQMRGLFYALAKKHHPQVTLADAGNLLTLDSMAVTNAVARVFGAKDDAGGVLPVEIVAEKTTLQ